MRQHLKRRFWQALVVLSAGCWPYLASSAVKSIQIQTLPGMTQVIFTANAPFSPKLRQLKMPPRLVVDLPLQHYKPKLPQSKGLIVRIRTGVHPDKFRIVFDLKQSVAYRAQKTPAKQSARFSQGQVQLSLVLKPLSFSSLEAFSKRGKQSKPQKSHRTTPKAQKAPQPIKTLEDVKKRHNKPFTVIVDAGHGGKDSGARGKLWGRWHNEKTLVLIYARKLAAALNKRGIKAHLTRSKDRFIPLRGRSSLARKHDADLFLSLHANAIPSGKARGALPFILSLKGADSEMSRFLSRKENEQLLSSESDLDGLPENLKATLVDLSTSQAILSSQQFGELLLKHFKKKRILLFAGGRVGKAAFAVLKSVDIPSLLLEIGFISSPKDLGLMVNSTYQDRYIQAVADAIAAYAKEHQF